LKDTATKYRGKTMFQLDQEQLQIQNTARQLAQGVIKDRAAEVDRSEEYPWDNVKLLTEAGFMGMAIPKAHGGLGRSYLDVALVDRKSVV